MTMTNKEFIWWLKGFLEERVSLNPIETDKIRHQLESIQETEIKSYYKTTMPAIDLTDLEAPRGPKIICEDDK